MTYHHERTTIAARGKWKGILQELGFPADALKNRHGPCPLCGSQDNFRWDDKEGTGSYICTCGAGQGMALAMAFTGQAFPDLAPRIDAMLGNIKPEAVERRPDLSDDDRKRMLRATVAETRPVAEGDLAHLYLQSRGIGERVYPSALRFGPQMRDGEGGVRPCMVALVGVHGETDANGRQRYCSLHRTFLRPDGLAKAEMASPRKMMPGPLPDGSCVMLSEWTGGSIGIAEGIETAMAASALFGLPVWAAINATMMTKWLPPPDAEDVTIFGDNDESHTGHAAAYSLSRRLRARGFTTSVMIPPTVGTDWNDELLSQRGAK